MSTSRRCSGRLDRLSRGSDIRGMGSAAAARQKMKGGTGHLWNPTDALNAQRRDPLQPFDLRPGVNALKLHIPVEKYGWNFYLYGLLDTPDPANVIGKLGAAARAGIIIPYLKGELGGGRLAVMSRQPRFRI